MKKTSPPRLPARFSKALSLMASPHVLFYVLPYMMLLLIAGTIAQKYVGVFTATRLFFSTFILWAGPLPLPGGATALAVLFLNLTAYFVIKSKWNLAAFGSSLTHLGVILLLLGGLITLCNKQEGFILLKHGQAENRFYDYHTREFLIERNGTVLWRTTFDRLKQGQTVHLKDMPFVLHLDTLYPNSTIDEKNALQKLPEKKEEETNQAGLSFTLLEKGKTHPFVTTEFLVQQPEYETKTAHYRFILRRASRAMPFALQMNALNQESYPGTDMAKSYETKFTVLEKDHAWPAHVSMNDPLRYKGYTFYQASVLTLPNGEQASVFNTVKDVGWLFPYAATALMCIGLFVNAWMRRHAK